MAFNDFVLNSKYGMLKNDSQANTISATVPNGLVFNVSNPVLATSTVSAGKINAGLRAMGYSSKYGKWVACVTLYSDINYTVPSFPGSTYTMTMYCNLTRINATTIQLLLSVSGGSGSPDFQIAETETITFNFSTFLSPFN